VPSSVLSALGHWLVRRRRLVLAAAALLAVVLALALPRLRVGFRIDGFFRSEDPALQRAMAHYDGAFDMPDRLLLFAWREADPFAADALARLREFAAAAARHEVVERVLTLANAPLPGARGDPAAIAASATWRHLFVARQGDAVAGVLLLRVDYRSAELPPLFADLRAAAAAAGRELQLCGIPYHTFASRDLVRRDMARFLPIGTAVSALLLFWLVPHFVLALLALAVVPLTLVSTLGVMAWCGIGITMLTSTLPTLLLCMSVADGVHFVGRFVEERDRDGDPRAAAARTFAAMFVPCLMTSLTTIVGFASLCTADLVDLRWLGLFAALGMVFAFVFTMAVLPAALSWVRSPVGRRPLDPARAVVAIARASQRLRPRVWLALFAVAGVASAFGATRVVTDHKLTADLWPDSDVMRQLRFYEERFVGVIPAEVVVDAPRGFGPAARAELAAFCNAVEALDGVSRTLSIADALADGVPPLALPALVAMGALPVRLLARDGRQARVVVFRGDHGTAAWQAFAAAVAAAAARCTVIQPRLAGVQMVGTAQVLRMTEDLKWSFAGSIVLILLLVWLQCRSVRLAGIAMAACLLPMLAVLAWMAAAGVTLRPLTVIAFCVALGLMIDDSIHLVARWQEERRAGRTGATAVDATLAAAGRPVVVTTLLLLVGFATILGSGFRGTFTFGLLVLVALSGALVASLWMLPALLRAADRGVPGQDTSGPP
jgi:predicted RND superfamily exporter protein